MSEWVDVTLPMCNGMPNWPGDHPFMRVGSSQIGEDGALINLSILAMCTHTGTHVDSPAHYLLDSTTVDRINLDLLIGPAYVLDVAGHRVIDAATVADRLPAGAKRLLLKTDNGLLLESGEFRHDYVALTVEASEYLMCAGVRLVGIDYMSVASYEEQMGSHLAILSNNDAVVLESLDLRAVSQGWYDMICLPLRVADGDGAPARVLLRKREEP